jgi:RNA polymerase sigma-70 factor (ECF subfamily)
LVRQSCRCRVPVRVKIAGLEEIGRDAERDTNARHRERLGRLETLGLSDQGAFCLGHAVKYTQVAALIGDDQVGRTIRINIGRCQQFARRTVILCPVDDEVRAVGKADIRESSLFGGHRDRPLVLFGPGGRFVSLEFGDVVPSEEDNRAHNNEKSGSNCRTTAKGNAFVLDGVHIRDISVNLSFTNTKRNTIGNHPIKITSRGFRDIFQSIRAMHDVTLLLQEMTEGDEMAPEVLLPLVYDELKKLARGYMRNERESHTLQTTALVHEAYVRLVDWKNADWQNRAHFFAVAAQMMRKILVDYARQAKAEKRGGGVQKIAIDDAITFAAERDLDLFALDEALTTLEAIDPRQSQIIELRFFGGLTIDETAEVMKLSPATIASEWMMARTWLHSRLKGEPR